MHKLGLKRVTLILVIIVACAFSAEAYAHSYVQVAQLPVVSSNDALTVPLSYNATATFSSNGAKWLIIAVLPAFRNLSQSGAVIYYVYKIDQRNDFFTQSVDIIPEDIEISSNPIGVHTDGALRYQPYLYEGNCTTAGKGYFISNVGTYFVDFSFRFKVYKTTPLGIFPLDEETIHFNETWTLPV
jgi:Uncharacterized protein conserved in bacteria